MSFSYNQIVDKVEELGLDPYYDMDSLPESDRDDILDHLFLACDAADNLDAALFTFMDGSDAARMIVSLAYGNLEEVGKAQVLDFLENADIDIKDLTAEKKPFDVDSFFPEVSEKERQRLDDVIQKSGLEYYKVQTSRYNNKNEKVFFDLATESLGTQKLFELAGPWIDALQNGHTLFIDEMNNHFHPRLIEYLISLFNSSETNKHNAQLVFTTHETSILNQNIFRRDQIWFVERDLMSGSSLFPLTDFSPRKSITNIETAYLSGRYGAIPNVKKSQLQVAEKKYLNS